MKEHKLKISRDSIIYDGLPPISAKYPWLVAHNPDADEENSQIFYNLNDPLSKYHCRLPELSKKRIRGCFHGWLILSDHSHNNNILRWSLWNPVTSETIRLPRLILKDGAYEFIRECCLSAPPHDPSSILVLTNTKKPTFVFCRLDSKRKKFGWIEKSYDKQLKRITGKVKDSLRLQNLACCNGKVFALTSEFGYADFIVTLDILVTDREVLIKLSLFGDGPSPESTFCFNMRSYLKGSRTELFYIIVAFLDETKKTPDGVYSFRLDMTSSKCEQLEVFKGLDMTDMDWKDIDKDGCVYKGLLTTSEIWEEMDDLKEAILFVDVACDFSVFYRSNVASELGGFIHIRSECGKVIYSYHVEKKTISISSIPSSTSNVLLWECRLEDNHVGEAQQEEEGRGVVRSVTNQEVEFNESLLLDLPFHMLEVIMELCVGVEYMNFRASCKLCHLAASLIKWSSKTTLSRLQDYSLVSPWLMVVDKNQGSLIFKDPTFGGNYFMTDPSDFMKNLLISIDDDRIYCSGFGWLLVYCDKMNCLVFYNPFTSGIRKLPETDYPLVTICFSAPPTSPDCMVVGFTMAHVGRVLIHFVARESSWRTLFLSVDPLCLRFQTFIGQDLYALCNEGKLIVFKDLGEEYYSFEHFEAKAPRSWCRRFLAQYFLMKCDQHLLLVIVGELGELVEVFKWNDDSNEWEKIDGLGKHMIYISATTCLCIEAKVPEMENKIYFPRLHSKNMKIILYSLETCRYHTFNDKNIEENFGDFIGTDYHLNQHVWIEPSWS